MSSALATQIISMIILWLNVKIHSQSEIYMAVTQLEFSLLQLIQQVDVLLSSIQSIFGGRLPMTLVNPWILYNILCNVSLQIARELGVNSWFKIW